MPRPCRISTAHVEQLGGELCVYDWDRNQVHALNPIAAAVWELCDGRSTPGQMAARLPAQLKTPDAEDIVWLALRLLADAHLLENPIAVPAGRSALSRRDLIARLGKAAAAIPAIFSIVAPTPLQAQSVSSQTFAFTGAQQTFVVPAGVTRLAIAAYGASGGASSSFAPGRGGRVTGTVAVTPGEMLGALVGGEGLVAGGFNGGGNGGSSTAGGGGGASLVRRGSTKLVVAGGGGGASSEGAGGGAGGGTTASRGFGWPGVAGEGGSQTAGGAGGDPNGGPGSLDSGGPGANAVSFFGQQVIGGGGGGGGFYGGGGGGAQPGHPGAGGGGGGSSYSDPAATDVTHLPGDRLGDGQVIISWT